MRSIVIVLALAGAARAERPSDGLFHASPGFGYSWDSANACAIEGRMFIGGFAFEYELDDGVFLGAATTILFNTLLPDAPCVGTDEGVRLAMSFVIGPSVEWYPYENRGLSLFGLAGYANIDHSGDEMKYGIGHGLGATVGVGWDWRDSEAKHRDLLFGLRLQVTAAHTWTTAFEHAALAPALVFLMGAD